MRYAYTLTLVFVVQLGATEPENLLKNPGFEDEVNTVWVANGKPEAPIAPQIDEQVFKSGKRSYRTGGNNFLQMVPIRQNHRYRVSAFMKCEDMRGDGAHVTVGAKDADRNWVKGLWARTESLKGTRDWKVYSKDNIVFPKGTAYAWVALYGPQNSKEEDAGGVAWFDDARFEDVTLEPLTKAMEGKTFQAFRQSVEDQINKSKSDPVKEKAKKTLDELEARMAKKPEEMTLQDVDTAVEWVEAIERLKSEAKIEDLLAE